jgi:large subunit ribosomal protein L31
MKPGIHPQYQKTVVTCISCKNTFETRSVLPTIEVEVCYKCHPFYTGKRTLVDTAGRVEKFRMKMQHKESLAQKDYPAKETPKEEN